MPLSPVKTWKNREQLDNTDLNAEFANVRAKFAGNIGGADMQNPFTAVGSWDLDGNDLLNVRKIYDIRNAAAFATIQAAVDDLAAGIGTGIVMIPPGTYNADTAGIVVPPGISLLGFGTDAVTITSPVAGTVIQLGSGADIATGQFVEGVKIAAQAANTAGITVVSAGGSAHSGAEVRRVVIDGATGTSFRGITNSGGDLYSLLLSNFNIVNCNNDGINFNNRVDQLIVQAGQVEGCNNGLVLTTMRSPLVQAVRFDANTNRHVILSGTLSVAIRNNLFTGGPSYDIELTTPGAGDVNQNLNTVIEDNTFLSTASYGIRLLGAVGTRIKGNNVAATYTNEWIQWGVASVCHSIEYGVNFCQEKPWSGDPIGHIAFAITEQNDVRPAGGGAGTSPTNMAVHLPVYAATPTTTSWSTEERGRTWIVDTGAAWTHEYWDGAAVRTV